MIDEAFADVIASVQEADLVILATPVAVIIDHLGRLHPHLASHALITDLGSTKRRICEQAAKIYAGGPLFLGGHPMAGKERSGTGKRRRGVVCKCPLRARPPFGRKISDDARVQAFRALVMAIGARPITSDPAAHDLDVAYLSHLPQLLSSGLAEPDSRRRAGTWI